MIVHGSLAFPIIREILFALQKRRFDSVYTLIAFKNVGKQTTRQGTLFSGFYDTIFLAIIFGINCILLLNFSLCLLLCT